MGAGAAYLTKKFDRIDNYKYIAIGSHVNAAVNLMAEYRWKPSPHIQLSAGIQLMHFSNGSLKTPNYGLNIPAVSAGVAFRLNEEQPHILRRPHPDLTMYEFDGKKHLEVKIGTIYARKQTGDIDGQKFDIYAGFISVMKSLNNKHNVGMCFDLSWDGSDALLVDRFDTASYNRINLTKPGIAIGYDLVLDRLSFALNAGLYLGGKDKSEGAGYFKFGIQYLIHENIFANLTLKTHYARADYFGLGLGYRFKWGYYRK